ncbi:MAG TPA: transglycosylase SLT domain-containing protein [Myxococcota bacterium]|nr:transglycosylase SLT domain-containing protein [Myxococcota bacterium]
MRPFAWLALLLCLARPAEARDVRVPIHLDYGFLRELLLATAFTDPEQTAVVHSDGVDCNHVVLSHPAVRGGEGAVLVDADVSTKFGTLFLGICLFAVEWQGRIASQLEPEIDPGAPLVRFRLRDSRLLEADGSVRGTTTTVWDWVEKWVRPRLEKLAIDLSAPMADLRATLPLFLSAANVPRAQALVDSLALDSASATPQDLVLGLRLDAPGAAPPEPAGAAPELTPDELARFEAALSRWDGFITYVVKNAGTQTTDPALREQLLEVLLDAREELVESLAAPVRSQDPVRPLFLATWRRLGAALRELGPQLGAKGALRYLGFVAAADALTALDALGPEFGFEMTADGMRRLARVIAPPADTSDPLAAPDTVDPELRRALDFGEPLPAPDLDEPAPDAPPEVTPAVPPEAPPDPNASRLDSGLRWLAQAILPAARAAEPVPLPSLPPLTHEEERRLRNWAPLRPELSEYLPLVQRLLHGAGEAAVSGKKTEPEVRRAYLELQLATAWQETCWRHYVRVNGQVRAIRSRAGAVGLMQVNSRVWRGFYDPRFLLGDPAYNARAGSEILVRYYLDLAYAKGEQRRGGIEGLVRATYSAYNGGPGALARYRDAQAHGRARSVDAAFFKKYQAVRAGRVLDVLKCFG